MGRVGSSRLNHTLVRLLRHAVHALRVNVLRGAIFFFGELPSRVLVGSGLGLGGDLGELGDV